jgi:hypothetical protein
MEIDLSSPEPHLYWLEAGNIQTIEQKSLQPISCHTLIQPLNPGFLPLWELSTEMPTETETASVLRETVAPVQDLSQALALEQLQRRGESQAFLDAIRYDRPMHDRSVAPTKPSVWQRVLRLFSTKQQSVKARTSQLKRAPSQSRSVGLWQLRQLLSRWFGSPSPSQTQSLGKTTGSRSRLQPRRLGRLARWFGGFGRKSGKPRKTPTSSLGSLKQPTGSLLQTNPLRNIGDYFRQRLMQSQLGQVLGQRQAQYFRRMMTEFEQGDLAEALKMAVPLSDYHNALQQRNTPNLGLPQKRQELNISRRQATSSRSFTFAKDSYQQMRSMYEKAHQHLQKSGQVKEAAFVLAELLNRVKEAVDYLSQQGFVAEAAEIAEGRLAPPDIAMKLWVEAGQIDRAINVAVRTNCFKTALLALKHSPHQYATVEALWVQRLLNNGDFETLFHHYAQSDHYAQDKENRKRLRQFLGEVLPKSFLEQPLWLARYSYFRPWAEVATSLEPLFAQPHSPDFTTFLETFLSLLKSHTDGRSGLQHQASQPLLKEWYRQILMYRYRPLQIPNAQLNLIRSLIRDRLFTDCKPDSFSNSYVETPASAILSTRFSFSPSEVLIQDVGLTPDGRFCLALGALGVQVYNSRGRCLNLLPIPAHGLVSPTTGGMVLAVEHREKLHRVHPIQLHQLKGHFLGQQPICAYGRHHNGFTWPVALGQRLCLIDVDATEWTSVWSTGSLEGTISQVTGNGFHLSFCLEDPEKTYLWQYRLPQLRLASRSSLEQIATDKPLTELMLGQDGQVYGVEKVFNAERRMTGVVFYRSVQLQHFQSLGRLGRTMQGVKILYGDATLLIVALRELGEGSTATPMPAPQMPTPISTPMPTQQVIKVYGIDRSKLVPIFELETLVGTIKIQANSDWLILAHGDQVLVYDRTLKQGSILKIN